MCDSVGIVLVEVDNGISRVVARDLRTDRLVVDARIDTRQFEQAGNSFVDWAEQEVLSHTASRLDDETEV